MLLKQEKPTAELLKHLMSREVATNDRFVSSAITYWMNEYDEKLGDLISSHLYKQVKQISASIHWNFEFVYIFRNFNQQNVYISVDF